MKELLFAVLVGGKYAEGTRAESMDGVSLYPPLRKVSRDSTSMGTGDSSSVRLLKRVPVTMTVCTPSGASVVLAEAGADAGSAPEPYAASETYDTFVSDAYCGIDGSV